MTTTQKLLKIFRLFFLSFLFLHYSLAHAEIKRLAVLEFNGVGIDKELLSLFADEARSGIIKSIDKNEILIMTKESTMQILKDMGKNASCLEGATCEVEVARNIGADYVVTGKVVALGSETVLTLKLHETQSAALLSSNTADAKDIQTLRKATANLARQLVIEGLGSSSRAAVAKTKSGFSGDFNDDWDVGTSSEGIVHFGSEPSGAIVILDGELLCQETPCSKEISFGGHKVLMQKERYQKQDKIIELKKGTKVTFKLIPNFGYLNVSSKIAGAKIFLDNEQLGVLPISQHKIDPGSYTLSIRDKCYIGKDYHFSISPNQTENVNDYPIKERNSGIKVSVSDLENNAKSAKVYVDGEYLGLSPLTKKIPLCSKKLSVMYEGKQYHQALSLEEQEVSEIRIKTSPASQNGEKGNLTQIPLSLEALQYQKTNAESKNTRQRELEKYLRYIKRGQSLLEEGDISTEARVGVQIKLAITYFKEGQYHYFDEIQNSPIVSAPCFNGDLKDCDTSNLKLNIQASQNLYQQTLSILVDIVENYPNHPQNDEALFYLGMTYNALNEETQALKYFEKLSRDYPKSQYLSKAHLQIGEYYFNRNQALQAFQAYKRIAKDKDSPYYSFAIYKLAWSCYNAGKYDKAIDIMKYLIQHIKPQMVNSGDFEQSLILETALRDLAFFFDSTGRSDEKEAFFKPKKRSLLEPEEDDISEETWLETFSKP